MKIQQSNFKEIAKYNINIPSISNGNGNVISNSDTVFTGGYFHDFKSIWAHCIYQFVQSNHSYKIQTKINNDK